MMCPKRDTPAPAWGPESAQGWGGGLWLQASCFFPLERGAFRSHAPPPPVRRGSSWPFPDPGGDAKHPGFDPAQRPPRRRTGAGFGGSRFRRDRGQQARPWAGAAGEARKAGVRAVCVREPRRPLPGAETRKPSPRRLSLAPPLPSQRYAVLGKQSALYKCWSDFPFILRAIHSAILPSLFVFFFFSLIFYTHPPPYS